MKLKNLHECVQDAHFCDVMYQSAEQYNCENKVKKNTREKSTQSFIIDAELKKELDSICRSNHATASSFLRECCKNLVSEYHNIGIDSQVWVDRFGCSGGMNDEYQD